MRRGPPVCRSSRKSLSKLFSRKNIYIYLDELVFFYNWIPVPPGKTGFEPATSGLTDQRYKPLSYFPENNELSTMIYYKRETFHFLVVDDSEYNTYNCTSQRNCTVCGGVWGGGSAYSNSGIHTCLFVIQADEVMEAGGMTGNN